MLCSFVPVRTGYLTHAVFPLALWCSHDILLLVSFSLLCAVFLRAGTLTYDVFPSGDNSSLYADGRKKNVVEEEIVVLTRCQLLCKNYVGMDHSYRSNKKNETGLDQLKKLRIPDKLNFGGGGRLSNKSLPSFGSFYFVFFLRFPLVLFLSLSFSLFIVLSTAYHVPGTSYSFGFGVFSSAILIRRI